jgi:hypothetical protein
MIKKIFGITFFIIALIISIAVIYQVPKTINTAFIRIDNLDHDIGGYILFPFILLILAFYIISFLLKLGYKWVRN